MPSKPQSHHNGLPKQQGYSPKRDYDQNRRKTDPALAKAAAIRNCARWKRTKDATLNARPLCCDPFANHRNEGRVEPATQVHHIHPLATHPFLAYHQRNLAPICTACHSQISSMERQGGEAARKAVELCKANVVCIDTQTGGEGGTGCANGDTQQGGGEVKSLEVAAPTPNCEVSSKFAQIFRGGGVAVRGGKIVIT